MLHTEYHRTKHCRSLGTVFSVKVAIYASMVCLGVYGVATLNGWSVLVPQLLLGAAYAHGVELTHQALHLTAYSNRSFNRLVGVLLGIPMLVSYSAYQESHLYHHQKVGTPDDREYFDYGNRSSTKMRDLVVHLLMLNHFMIFVRRSLQSFSSGAFEVRASKERVAKIKAEYRLMFVLALGAMAYTIALEDLLIVYAWLIPLLAFATPIHALIELPEHYACNKLSRDCFQNTRTIRSNWFMAWYTNSNNFHVEHHLYPAVPVETLRVIHESVVENIVYKNDSYSEFYARLLRNVFLNHKG